MPHNADGVSVSDWGVQGDCVLFGESDSEYPMVIRLSAIEAAHMRDDDTVVISTDRSEYEQTVNNPRGLIARIAQALREVG